MAPTKKTPLGKTSSTDEALQSPLPKETRGEIGKDPSPKGRFRSYSSAANLDRPTPFDQIKPKLRVDTTPPIINETSAPSEKREKEKEREKEISVPFPDVSISPPPREPTSLDLISESAMKRAEALIVRYTEAQEMVYACMNSTVTKISPLNYVEKKITN